MAINIQKPLDKAYLVTQLEAHERYMLYDQKQKTVIVTVENYISCLSSDPGALLIVADSVVPGPNEVIISDVDAVVGTGVFNVGDYVIYVPETTRQDSYLRHRYRKLDETYDWQASYEYAAGVVCIYDEKMWQCTQNHISSTTFDESKWSMVGAASIFNVVDALPPVADLDEDQAFILKADEMDTSTSPATVVHKKGMWIFNATTKAYTQFDEHEDKDLDFAEIWDSTTTSTYKGDEKVVDSKYLYTQLKVVGDKIWDEINDLYDIVGQPEYIVVDTKAALDAYDLTTLPDNSVAMFMVRTDETQAIPGTTPTEYYSTLYVCVCDDDGTTRTVSYVGHLQYGERGLSVIIEEAIYNALHEEVPGHYEKSTDADALTVVADGTITDPSTEIEESNVSPVLEGEVIAVGDKVKWVDSYIGTVWKFILRSEVDAATLQKISHSQVVYTDPDGVEADVTVDYLTYNSQKLMPREFENKDIDFTNTSEYDPIVEG